MQMMPGEDNTCINVRIFKKMSKCTPQTNTVDTAMGYYGMVGKQL